MDYKKLFDLTGKVCIVTGGTGYLGSANVKALKDFGATVVVASRARYTADGKDRSPEGCDHFVICDVSSSESLSGCFKEVYDKYGRIDVLVNCANGSASGHGKQSFLEYMPDELFDRGVIGCVGACFRGIREVVPYMKETGGSIINYCSMYGLVSPDLRIYGDSYQRQPPNYGAGKAAVDQLTRYAAGDLAHYGIRVNSVTPGPFPAPANQANVEFNKKLAGKTMLGRFGQNYEMSGAVVLLASDAGSFMTGTNIVVDGGWTAW